MVPAFPPFPTSISFWFHVVGSATSNVIVGHMVPITSQYAGTVPVAATGVADVMVTGLPVPGTG
jgi:hypothetical protein